MAEARWIGGMRETWYQACEVLLSADPGLAEVLPACEVAARLAALLELLSQLGAAAEQLSGLTLIVERWREGPPGAHQWYLDYRWVGAQEGTRRRFAVTV